MFLAPFSFKGRIRRTEYGISYLIYMIVSGSLRFFLESDPDIAIFFTIIYIPLIWFMLAQGTKRCHDRGNSGWFQIIPFYLFWMIFAKSDFGKNEYGNNPKGEGNDSEIEEIGLE
ncbi:MAG: hypothetical protein COA58_14325 [Bacteroidetes bacterium]|nr:MAG: hypothetical protein COA58_14325 [Bacteroidota bacterium]